MSKSIMKKQIEVIENLRHDNDEKDKKIKELELLVRQQKTLIEEQKFHIKSLELQQKIERERKFGRKSDSSYNEPNLFNFDNEVEENADPNQEEPISEEDVKEEITYTRTKNKKRNFINTAQLPKNIIEHIPEGDLVCEFCGGELVRIGSTVVRELNYIPSRLELNEHHYPTYKCKHNCTEGEGLEIINTIKNDRPFIGTMASENTVSHIIVEKFCKFVPLYRQEKFFHNIGVDISRQTLCNWIMYAGEYIKVIANQMHKDLIENDIIMMDETTTRVLDSTNKQAYIWLASSSKHDIPINLYLYKDTREYHHAADIIEGGKVKFIQSDLYQAYQKIDGVVDVACWAHAKRKFDEIHKVTKGNSNFKIMNEDLEHSIREIRKLYHLEHSFKKEKYSIEEIAKQRQSKALPIINSFYEWCVNARMSHSEGSQMYKAFSYVINGIEALKSYTMDGRLEIDNNRSERIAKSYKTGLKNWLFNITSNGADTSCAILSVVTTAIDNGLNVYDYLVHLLRGMAKYRCRLDNLSASDIEEIRKLLPYSTDIPQEIRVKDKKNS